jgi:hypothetical protein
LVNFGNKILLVVAGLSIHRKKQTGIAAVCIFWNVLFWKQAGKNVLFWKQAGITINLFGFIP